MIGRMMNEVNPMHSPNSEIAIRNQNLEIINPISRRQLLARVGGGFGALGLAAMLGGDASAANSPAVASPLAPKAPHFTAKAKRVIYLFMNGGPSHVDTFDYKPELEKQSGKQGARGKYMPSPFKFAKHGQSGLEVSEIYPHVA